jgi:hypothetical protein
MVSPKLIFFRHCERSEAIQGPRMERWIGFVASLLAMTATP